MALASCDKNILKIFDLALSYIVWFFYLINV